MQDSTDALDYAVPFDAPELNHRDIEDSLGFNCTTGCDAAIRNAGMLAVGLQLQDEYDRE
ncbi:hypothetical protein [Methanobrevibacter gottschalkii]|uniref:hypothetical protein n=1 Tax=Methanobrevibacter gottschalkii TaxID=190974 RepID=UPI0038D005E3